MQPTNKPVTPVPGTLNVFLHGLFTILDRDNGLEILIPDMGPSHAYRKGEFLGEVDFPPTADPISLENVTGGAAHFDSLVNLVAHGVPPLPAGKVYARLQFPLPLQIFSKRSVDLTDSLVDPGRVFSSKTVSLVQVLTYGYADNTQIKLGGEFLTSTVAPLLGPDNKQYVNLHIFAEEDAPRDPSHTIDGFNAIVSLLDLSTPPKLNDGDTPLVQVAKADLPPGTTTIEFFDLAPRTIQVGILGRHLRLAEFALEPHVPSGLAIGEQPSTCSSCVTRIH
jgi:hypothetical protein